MTDTPVSQQYCVYKHTSPSGKVYIGLTCQKPERRWGKNGEHYMNKGKFGYTYFGKAIEKHGWDNIKHEILFVGLTKDEACLKEKEMIKHYNSANKDFGYNLTFGGEAFVPTDELRKKMSLSKVGIKISEKTKEKIRIANMGKHASKETKEKLSLAKKGKPSPRKGYKFTYEERVKSSLAHKGKNIGRICSDETKKKISEAHKGKKMPLWLKEKLIKIHAGKKLTNEQRKKISESLKGNSRGKGCRAWNKGKKLSEEHRRKLSESHKGQNVSDETRKLLSKKTKEYWMRKKEK